MKKFFVPLFFFLLFGCSDGFKSEIAATKDSLVWCKINGVCESIGKSLCLEIGGDVFAKQESCEGTSSSSDDDVSSSSDVVDVSSSSDIVDVSSSSDVVDVSSSSGDAVVSSSSVVVDVSSSSGDVVASSSSGDAVVSSSSVVVDVSSSSDIIDVSSSSVGVSSSSLAPPSLGTCSPFPFYVAKTKREYIKGLVPIEGNSSGCNVTYTLSGSSSITITGDSISFSGYSSSSRELTLTITARLQCQGTPTTKPCTIPVFIADDYRDARCNHRDIFEVNLNNIHSTTTVIEYACCEPKNDYFLTCAGVNYTLKIKSSTSSITSSGGNANLPDIAPIPEFNAQCPIYNSSPGDALYRYPERILMTVTNASAIPTGGFSCNSW